MSEAHLTRQACSTGTGPSSTTAYTGVPASPVCDEPPVISRSPLACISRARQRRCRCRHGRWGQIQDETRPPKLEVARSKPSALRRVSRVDRVPAQPISDDVAANREKRASSAAAIAGEGRRSLIFITSSLSDQASQAELDGTKLFQWYSCRHLHELLARGQIVRPDGSTRRIAFWELDGARYCGGDDAREPHKLRHMLVTVAVPSMLRRMLRAMKYAREEEYFAPSSREPRSSPRIARDGHLFAWRGLERGRRVLLRRLHADHVERRRPEPHAYA